MAVSGDDLMLVDVWKRIKDILVIAQGTLLTDSGLILTLAQAPPRGAKEYEKFACGIGMRTTSFNQTGSSLGETDEQIVAISFPIDVFSQPIKLDYDVRMMENILTVADTITSEFNKRQLLENVDGIPLRYINVRTPTILTGGSIIKEPFPGTPGNAANVNDMRYHFFATINVSYIWSCPDRST